jgi:hypothetical protein
LTNEFIISEALSSSYHKLQTPDRLNLPVIAAVKIPFRGANMRMTHQTLNRPEIIPFIQKGRSEGMSHDDGMNSLLNQSPLCRRLDQAVNSLGS